ncbi:MAG: GAF domain-containing protein [Acidobacteriota bacterium]|nr:GAF domain-containing protein [Acidobacteriota bacterium]
MRSDTQRIIDLQSRVANSQLTLKKLFRNAKKSIGADQGFLAFEDPHGYLSIFISEGQYWHLPKDQGLTGRAFKNGKPIISGEGDTSCITTDGVTFSEMIVPIFQYDHVVGAMLMDNMIQKTNVKFTKREQAIAVSYADLIRDILEAKEPWGFYSWWTEHQGRKQVDYAEKLEAQLREIVDGYPDIIISIHMADGKRHGKLIHKQGNDITDLYAITDPIKEVLAGKPILSQESAPVSSYLVPFPAIGPVLGYVKLQKPLLIPKKLCRLLESSVQRISYDPLSPAATTILHPEEHFFNLIYQTLLLSKTDMDNHRSLMTIAEKFHMLTTANVRIQYLDYDYDDVDGTTEEIRPFSAVPITDEGLEDWLKGHRGREHATNQNTGWLSAPVFVDGKLCGSFDMRSIHHEVEGRSVEDAYNSKLAEIGAFLAGRIMSH